MSWGVLDRLPAGFPARAAAVSAGGYVVVGVGYLLGSVEVVFVAAAPAVLGLASVGSVLAARGVR